MHRLTMLALLLCFLTSATQAFPVGADDDFASRTILPAGQRAFSDTISGGTVIPGADTTLGVFDGSGTLFDYDDDSSPFGGLASGLYYVPVNVDGSASVAVSGYADFDFDGLDDGTGSAHIESGDCTLYIDVYDPNSNLMWWDEYDFTLTPGGVSWFDLPAGSFDPSWDFDVYIDNNSTSTPGADEIDFVSFAGLAPGTSFIAEITAADFDTMLGWYDDSGVLIDCDDDGGAGLLSRIEATVPASGVVNLAVSGYDWYGDGFTTESGCYTLELVPEPVTLALLTVGAAAVLTRRRR